MDLPILVSSHTFLVNRAIQLFSIWENSLMVDDDGFDNLIHMSLAGHLILYLRDRHQCGAKTDGQVIRVHHVFITVLWKTAKESKTGVIKAQGEKRKCLIGYFLFWKWVFLLEQNTSSYFKVAQQIPKKVKQLITFPPGRHGKRNINLVCLLKWHFFWKSQGSLR